jgi:pyruvate dehydrogenase E2 component (dihydrolipoamide acetyltransferase)
VDVLMPQLGETVAEGKITKWFKAAGEAVKPGDTLFEIETDKTSMEVPAIAAGVLAEIRVPEGEVAPVGAVVAIIADAAVAATSAAVTKAAARGGMASSAPGPAGPAAAAAAGQKGPALRARSILLDPFFEVRTAEGNYGPARLPGGTAVTPLARRLAGEAGINPCHIKGSGAHGQIVARDVEAAIAAAKTERGGTALAGGPSADQIKAFYEPGSYEEVPLDGMRRTIAARLVEAKQTIPHFYLAADVDIDELLKLREEANATAAKSKDGSPAFKLSLNDLLIKTWAAALQRVPAANAVWAVDRILRFRHSDIGVAVAIDGGLFTPIIRNAERKSLTAISTEMKDLTARARARRLKPQDYQGGSSTISNLGMYGIRSFSAIINPPHATILAVGAARRQPVEQAGGGIAFVIQMTVTLSCDHRVVDGVLGAELLAAFKGFVEKPVTALA